MEHVPGWSSRHATGHPYELEYPFRGHRWTVTQDERGLRLRMDPALDVQIERTAVSVRVSAGPGHVRIHVLAREDGSGKLVAGMPGIARTLAVAGAARLRVRVNGALVPAPSGNVLTVEFRNRELDVEVERTSSARNGVGGLRWDAF